MFSAPYRLTKRTQIFGELDTVRAFAAAGTVLRDVRVAHVRDAGQRRAEPAPVVDDSGQRRRRRN